MNPPASLAPAQIEAATACLREYSGVCATYLHGSATKGGLRADSDIDIAVLTTRGQRLPSELRLEIAARLEGIFGREVDVGVLSAANLIYAREVAEHGQRLFTRNALESDRFIAQALSQYADLQRSRKAVIDAYAA